MTRRARISAVLVLTVTGVSWALGQTTPTSEQSSAALGRLNYFAGTWQLEVHMTMSPLGSRAFFGTEHNEWERGGSLLVSRQEGLPGGLAVMAYNPREKAYTYHVVKDTGEAEDLRGTLADHTWTWMSYSASGNPAPRTRFIVQETSPISYSVKFETSSEGRDWSTVMEGKAVKVLPNAHQDVAFLR